MAGHVGMKDMGARVERDQIDKPQKKTPVSSDSIEFNDMGTIEDLSYYPTTNDNRQVLNLLMIEIHKKLPDTTHDAIISATDVVLEILKNDELDASTKRKDIDELLGTKLDDLEFNEYLNLSNRITDYGISDNQEDEDVEIAFEDEDDEQPDEVIEDEVNEDSVKPHDIPLDDTINGEDAIIRSTSTNESLSTKTISVVEIHKNYLDDFKLNDDFKQKFLNIEIATKDLKDEIDLELKSLEKLLDNRWKIVFKLKYLESGLDAIKQQLLDMNMSDLLNEFVALENPQTKKRRLSETEDSDSKKIKPVVRQPKLVDLSSLIFDQGSRLMASTKVKLPKGSYQQNKKLYDIISVPPPEISQEIIDARNNLVPISTLPSWAHEAFPLGETSTLNVVQSKIYPMAFESDENILLCAPTGAGKTNVAMLTILRTIGNFRDKNGKIRLNDFKIVYIAPLKALVSEQMREFQRRLTSYGITVNQLSGDSSLSKSEIVDTQIIITTPEKWDVITRKTTDSSYVNLVRLVIIDEIHLLHDERGPVLESIVSRTLRHVEETGLPVRLVGLSATLPNYEDVAKFLRVDKGLFFFDAAYRPCPLEQKFVGIKEKKAIKKLAAMNEACYDQLEGCMANNHQMIIFVHSRKETFKTAHWLKEKLTSEGKLDGFLNGAGVKEILTLESDNMTNENLKDILPSGIGIHHAGLNKDERSVVEDLFAQGHLKVLVSTATLAWGVNLPAHTVVIKGTETYSPERGIWVQLSPQDILQMLGRAGRPRYDKSGEGVIITSQDEIQYYLAILNQQLPIESQLMSRLADNLNAEIVLGTVASLEDAVGWLSYTYLYIRMCKSPGLYHVGSDYKDDETLYWKRVDMAHSALTVLQENKLISYDNDLKMVRPTELGKIASHYYIKYDTMNMYNSMLKPWLTEIDILSIFSRSDEFKYIPIRQEEKFEVKKMTEKCPIPIKESSADPLSKINVLLQSYISRLTLDGFALISDMIYVTQSAGRLIRAIYEICLRKNWSSLSKITLNLCKMIERRMWLTNSPLRQFGSLASKEIIRATETSHLPFVTYFNLSPETLAEAINLKGNSKRAYQLLQQFPKLTLSYYAQPLTSDLLRVQVEVVPDWDWNFSIHGNSQQFLMLVEDCDGDTTLYRDLVVIDRYQEKKSLLLEFTVPLVEPIQPNYYVTFINEKWLHSEFRIPIKLSDIKVPKKSTSFTRLNKEVLNVSGLQVREFEELFDFKYFNGFQSQVFHSLYNTDDNVFIGMSKGCGKTVCGELAMLNHWREGRGRILYLNPSIKIIDKLTKYWRRKFNDIGGGKSVDKLSGELTSDLATLSENHLILATPDQFEYIARRWRQRKVVQAIEMVVADDIHMLGTPGINYENCIAKMRFISTQVDHPIRFIALGNPLATGRDFGDYLGCPKQSIYNFDPAERFHKIEEIRLQGSTYMDTQALVSNNIYLTYKFCKENTKNGSSMVFVANFKTLLDVAFNFESLAETDDWKLSRTDEHSLLDRIGDHKVKNLLQKGIGILHDHMTLIEQAVVMKYVNEGWVLVVVATAECAEYCPGVNNVVILGTEYYEGKEHRYIGYSINTILEMIGCCKDELNQGKVVIHTKNSVINHYSRLINDGLPLESYYQSHIHDIFINEITTRVLKNRQDCIDWLTFTYFYRRLQLNPSFYDVKDVSHMGISAFLSDLVEDTIKDLVDGGLVEDEDEEDEEDEDDEDTSVSPLNGALIASHYGVRYQTMMELNKLDNKSKLRSILEIICSASEFEDLSIRYNEPILLEKIYNQVPVKSNNVDFESPYFKTFILLQAHFSRLKLPIELGKDLKFILSKVLNIIGATVDFLSSEGYLNSIQAIDLSQMIVQGLWNRDSPIKQLPHINEGILSRCKKYNVETVYDIMTLEDDERDDLLQLEGEQLEEVAEFVNKYPNVDISYELPGEIVADEPSEVIINLERDEDVDDLDVVAPYPGKKEQWWVIIGDSSTRQLYGIKKTTIAKEQQQVKVDITIPNSGEHELTVWVMCDSYLDADKELKFKCTVD